MDKKLTDAWAESMSALMHIDPDRRRHFALLLVSLVKCYTNNDEWKAVILIHNQDALLTFSAGADEAEAAEMLQTANEAVMLAATADAPPKEMFN